MFILGLATYGWLNTLYSFLVFDHVRIRYGGTPHNKLREISSNIFGLEITQPDHSCGKLWETSKVGLGRSVFVNMANDKFGCSKLPNV